MWRSKLASKGQAVAGGFPKEGSHSGTRKPLMYPVPKRGTETPSKNNFDPKEAGREDEDEREKTEDRGF